MSSRRQRGDLAGPQPEPGQQGEHRQVPQPGGGARVAAVQHRLDLGRAPAAPAARPAASDATAGTAQASGPGISPARCSQPSSDRSAVTVSFAVPFRIDGHVSTTNAVTSGRRQRRPGPRPPSAGGHERPHLGRVIGGRLGREPPLRDQVTPVAVQQLVRRAGRDRRRRLRRHAGPAQETQQRRKRLRRQVEHIAGRPPGEPGTAPPPPASARPRPGPRLPATGSRAPSGTSARMPNRSYTPAGPAQQRTPPHTAEAGP